MISTVTILGPADTKSALPLGIYVTTVTWRGEPPVVKVVLTYRCVGMLGTGFGGLLVRGGSGLRGAGFTAICDGELHTVAMSLSLRDRADAQQRLVVTAEVASVSTRPLLSHRVIVETAVGTGGRRRNEPE
ncbi:hypothetical protein ACWDZ4_12655 [Streptomyces sp. NPDC003016]